MTLVRLIFRRIINLGQQRLGCVCVRAGPEPFDFRLEQVASINASGHKYGLVYPGVGWLIFRAESMAQVAGMLRAIAERPAIPVATVLLVRTGLVKREALSRNRGYVLLGIFIIAAFLTPPDPVSQTMMALPMYALYEIGLLMSRALVRAGPPDPEDDPA